jgi:hypothetical protein
VQHVPVLALLTGFESHSFIPVAFRICSWRLSFFVRSEKASVEADVAPSPESAGVGVQGIFRTKVRCGCLFFFITAASSSQ